MSVRVFMFLIKEWVSKTWFHVVWSGVLRGGRAGPPITYTHLLMIPHVTPMATYIMTDRGSIMADHATVEMPEKGQNAEMQSHQKSRARIVGGKVPPLDLEWEGLRVDVSVPVKAGKLPCSKVTEATEKTILNNASGIVRSGELVAVMGARSVFVGRILN